MDINITKLTDKEIAGICLKYNIIQSNELKNNTREQVIHEIQKWVHYKKTSYKQRRHSAPNISVPTSGMPNPIINQQNNIKTIASEGTQPGLKRSMSQPLNIQKTNNAVTSPPQPSMNRDRRMSEPFTTGEKNGARKEHQAKTAYHSGQNEVRRAQTDPNMDNYDQIGMYPKVRRLIAVGDLHGDLNIT